MNICVFSGASTASPPDFLVQAERIGAMIAARGFGFIYGGGCTGMMGASAKGALGQGGIVHGIIPRFLQNLEPVNHEITRLTLTETMHERKQIMYHEAHAFIVMPGGLGTMEEMLEVLTWRQLHVIHKPIYIFNPDGFWDSLRTLFTHAGAHGFIQKNHLELIQFLDSTDDIADILDTLLAEWDGTESSDLISKV